MSVIRRSLLVTLVLGLALLGGFVIYIDNLPRNAAASPARTDAIVVLTGGDARIAEGLRLLAAERAGRLLITGVNEAVTMEALLQFAPDVPASLAERITVDRRAGDTIGNARETAAWVAEHKVGSIRLVTAAYHMPRSLMELRRALPGVEIIAHPVFPDGYDHTRWWVLDHISSLLFQEYLKYVYALLTGPFRTA